MARIGKIEIVNERANKEFFSKKSIIPNIFETGQIFDTEASLVLFVGPNGSGKTTLLRGIHMERKNPIAFLTEIINRQGIELKNTKLCKLYNNAGTEFSPSIYSSTIENIADYIKACLVAKTPMSKFGYGENSYENLKSEKEFVPVQVFDPNEKLDIGKLSPGQYDLQTLFTMVKTPLPGTYLLDEPDKSLDMSQEEHFQESICNHFIDATKKQLFLTTHNKNMIDYLLNHYPEPLKIIGINKGEITNIEPNDLDKTMKQWKREAKNYFL